MYSPIASLSNITFSLSLSLSSQLGFVKLNLAEYAGAGVKQRKYLLESYNENKHKPDNSLLKVRTLHCPPYNACTCNTCTIYVLYMCCLCNSDTPYCCVGTNLMFSLYNVTNNLFMCIIKFECIFTIY